MIIAVPDDQTPFSVLTCYSAFSLASFSFWFFVFLFFKGLHLHVVITPEDTPEELQWDKLKLFSSVDG